MKKKYDRTDEKDFLLQHNLNSANPPPVCKKFGCGKILTPVEYLFGDYCFKHQRENKKQKL